MIESPFTLSNRPTSRSTATQVRPSARILRHADRRRAAHIATALIALVIVAAAPVVGAQEGGGSGWTLVGWNDLGMHCMDADYSIFSILPPYNTIHAQLIDPSGELVTEPSEITVCY